MKQTKYSMINANKPNIRKLLAQLIFLGIQHVNWARKKNHPKAPLDKATYYDVLRLCKDIHGEVIFNRSKPLLMVKYRITGASLSECTMYVYKNGITGDFPLDIVSPDREINGCVDIHTIFTISSNSKYHRWANNLAKKLWKHLVPVLKDVQQNQLDILMAYTIWFSGETELGKLARLRPYEVEDL